MKLNIRFFITLTTLLLSVYSSLAQESCTQNLEDARELFGKGQIDKVPELLNGCLKKGFTRSEKVEAYRLLTLCHLYYNRSTEAAESMKLMLKFSTEYKIQDIDPSEFQMLYKTFRTFPIMIIGIKGGIGTLYPINIQNYNDINSDTTSINYNSGGTSNIGFSMEIPILKNLSISPEVYFTSFNYSSVKNLLNYSTVYFNEYIKTVEAPIMLQYNILKDKKAIPYLTAGATLSYMIDAKGNINREDILNGSRREAPYPNFSTINSRNRFNYGLTGGVGVRVKDIVGTGYITFDIRYSQYLKNHVEESVRAENQEAIYSYLYTDNSFSTAKFQFFLGYKLPFYRPKQKKKNRVEQ